MIFGFKLHLKRRTLNPRLFGRRIKPGIHLIVSLLGVLGFDLRN